MKLEDIFLTCCELRGIQNSLVHRVIKDFARFVDAWLFGDLRVIELEKMIESEDDLIKSLAKGEMEDIKKILAYRKQYEEAFFLLYSKEPESLPEFYGEMFLMNYEDEHGEN